MQFVNVDLLLGFIFYSWLYGGGTILFLNGVQEINVAGISLFGYTNLRIDTTQVSLTLVKAQDFVCQTRDSGRDFRAPSSILDPGKLRHK